MVVTYTCTCKLHINAHVFLFTSISFSFSSKYYPYTALIMQMPVVAMTTVLLLIVQLSPALGT